MRAICTSISGIVLVGLLFCFAPGCDSASNSLEKPPPDVTKTMDPMRDMPGYKEQQEKLKAKGKIKG